MKTEQEWKEYQQALMLEIDGPHGLLNKSKSDHLYRRGTWLHPRHRLTDREERNILISITIITILGCLFIHFASAQAVPVQPSEAEVFADSIEATEKELPPQVDTYTIMTEQTDPEPLGEATVSSNSVYNWQFAVDRWNECKTDVSFYQDWVNWYGEESAMRMCIITHSENGSRDPGKVIWNGTHSADVGLFQINSRWHCGKVGEEPNSDACIEALTDPSTNLMVARQIYEAQGWSPWVAKDAYMPEFHTDRLTIN